jgi:hypothetical protein
MENPVFELRLVRYKAPYGEQPRLVLEYQTEMTWPHWKEVPIVDSPEYAELRQQQEQKP